MNYSNEALASNLRAERARRDLSQEELAARSGVSAASLIKYESGEMTPGIDKVISMAEALGCTPNDLCGWKST